MELRDSPVVRPLFFTAWLIEAVSVVFEIVPISRIEPLQATFPATTFPTEQSTLLPGSGTLLRHRQRSSVMSSSRDTSNFFVEERTARDSSTALRFARNDRIKCHSIGFDPW